MLSWGDKPICVLEDTTHIVRMNVYQRVPRLFLAARMGIPAIALQGTRGLDFSKRGDCWGMHRYMRAFAAISRLYPNSAVLPFFYVPTDGASEVEAERLAFQYLDALVRGDDEKIGGIRELVIAQVAEIAEHGFRGHFARDIPSIEVSDDEVIVHIGANPDKKSWREKGSGQMDPYIGLIAAAKYIYCFDSLGKQVRAMVVRFTNLPPNFWWFRDWQESRSLYKTLAFQLADRVEFCAPQGPG
jgi:hypothetical protein